MPACKPRRCDTAHLLPTGFAVPFLDLLSAEHVCTNLAAADKPQLLEKLAAMLARDGDEQPSIATALKEREMLGSTGLGNGVAIPHGRIESLGKPRVALIRLAEPLEFGSIDGQPVDLVAAMVVPEQNTDLHLQLLAELAEFFSHKDMVKALRNAADGSALHAELAEFSRNRIKEATWTD